MPKHFIVKMHSAVPTDQNNSTVQSTHFNTEKSHKYRKRKFKLVLNYYDIRKIN